MTLCDSDLPPTKYFSISGKIGRVFSSFAFLSLRVKILLSPSIWALLQFIIGRKEANTWGLVCKFFSLVPSLFSSGKTLSHFQIKKNKVGGMDKKEECFDRHHLFLPHPSRLPNLWWMGCNLAGQSYDRHYPPGPP